MANFYKHKMIIVTGGAGFIGSHLVEMLVEQGAFVRVVGTQPPSQLKFLQDVKASIDYHQVDLLSPLDSYQSLFKNQTLVFHLAARVAGIEYNRHHPATMLRDNSQMALNVFEAARIAKVDRIQFVSSACVYPRYCTIPTPESEGFLDEPEPTNYGYGWAKRFGELVAKTYAQEFKLGVSIVRPYNCYGPRDDFNPATSHVIPALIRRVLSKEDPIVVWGDGTATRSFLYVEDFARGLTEAMEHYPQPDAVNIGTNEEVTIKELIELIVKISGVKSNIEFDSTKPNGQPRRNCNTAKAINKIGFKAKVDLATGLKNTIEWYQQYGQKN